MSDIRDTILPIRPDAVWTDETCPKCNHYFVAKDQHGLYCCMDGCEWTGIKETTYMTKKCYEVYMTDDEGYYLEGGFYTESELREILERGAIRRLVGRFIKDKLKPQED